MKEQKETDFNRIADAIAYIQHHFKRQPSLEEIAEHVHLSPFHLQRLFTEWAGVSPKKFLQYLSVRHAKEMLKEQQATLFDTAIETGFSGTGRLHDLFVTIEGMTPGEYKNGGEGLSINYNYGATPFGDILVASTQRGICSLTFIEDEENALNELKTMFPNALFQQKEDVIQQNALRIFTDDWEKIHEIKLHLKGTDFQLKVWETLLTIPSGNLATYGSIANKINNAKASRAVGSAIGSNPIAFIIPCHRVIQSTGTFGQYMWGATRKASLIGWEAAKAGL